MRDQWYECCSVKISTGVVKNSASAEESMKCRTWIVKPGRTVYILWNPIIAADSSFSQKVHGNADGKLRIALKIISCATVGLYLAMNLYGIVRRNPEQGFPAKCGDSMKPQEACFTTLSGGQK